MIATSKNKIVKSLICSGG